VKSRHTMDLTTGPVAGKLFRFAFPILVSNILQHLYNAADKAVVGQFAGKIALAAVGSTGSATTLLLNMLYGLSVGASIINSNLLGGRNYSSLRRSMHTTISLAGVCGVLFCALGLIVCKPLLQLMSCPETVIEDATLYMRIIFCGVPASIVYNFGAGILRTHGDTRRPMLILAVTGIVNVCLNLVFVIVFHMTVEGVALATIIAQYLSAAAVLYILFKPNGEFKLSIKELSLPRKEAVAILRVGIPCGINSMMFSISNVTVQSSVNSFGDTILAGNVAADGYTGLLYQVLAAFYSACVTFSGQCYGAHRHDRIDKLLLNSCALGAGTIVVASVISTLFPDALLSLFNKDPEVIRAGTPKLLITSWAYTIYAVSEALMGCLRGMRKSTVPTSINIFCICIVRVLWVMFIFPLNSQSVYLLYSCYPVSYFLAVSSLGIYYLYVRRQQRREALASV